MCWLQGWFYTLVSTGASDWAFASSGTVDQEDTIARQQYLKDQGYAYTVLEAPNDLGGMSQSGAEKPFAFSAEEDCDEWLNVATEA